MRQTRPLYRLQYAVTDRPSPRHDVWGSRVDVAIAKELLRACSRWLATALSHGGERMHLPDSERTARVCSLGPRAGAYEATLLSGAMPACDRRETA